MKVEARDIHILGTFRGIQRIQSPSEPVEQVRPYSRRITPLPERRQRPTPE
jgi:hypothetical protein